MATSFTSGSMSDIVVIRKEAKVNSSLATTYKVVSDFQSYPEFVSMCRSVTPIESKECLDKDSAPYSQHLVKMDFSFGKLSYSMTTRNKHYDNRVIQVELVKGPVESLTGSWTFTALEANKTLVEAQMDFIVKNLFLRKMFHLFIEELTSHLVKSFTERAESLNG